ncbi:hypothetical protein I6H52_10270 [Corynebacterium urealyticum]|uniref:hypothetical protein n=1 Tax=Corynebacterium urealyticum TaxID=43771 RepID=UPI0019102B6C|nr:hypothetical protein [Corynebacterium urealyticum]QQE50836.1 hypothetical protein I6H52_10270 [Corynebacterium urealyticum]
MKSLRINRGVAAGAAAVSLLFTATGVAAPSLLSQAAAESTSKNLALKCTYNALGNKVAETSTAITVDMPTEVDAGADIPVKVTTGTTKITNKTLFSLVESVSAKASTVRLQVSPNAELVGSPQGITLANGVLSISNVLSAAKTSSSDITVTAKPAEFTLRSKDGEKVTVGTASNIISLTMGTSSSLAPTVPTNCTTTAVQMNQTAIKAAPAPEPTPDQPDPTETEKPGETTPEQPDPTETEKPGETTPEQPDPTETEKPGEPTPEQPDPTETEKPGETTTPDKPTDPPAGKDPQGSSTDGIASFFKKIFGIDKSDEGKNTAKTFWLSFFGSGLLAVIISAVLNFIR